MSNTCEYFNHVPKEWDAFYSHENRLAYWINRILRRGLYERYRLTFEYCGDLNGVTVLDIGCGTGRYSIECAKRGAAHVTGIDFAPLMIDFSRALAKEMKVDDRCEFVCGDFLRCSFNRSFDIILALGFFDYIKEPLPIFKKIAQLRPRKFVASFPKFHPVWSIQRWMRYYLIKRCPIYNYSKDRLEKLYKEAGFKEYNVIPCGIGYFVFAGNE